MIKVLVMCHANRYRSPLAAAFLAEHKNLEVRSAGFMRSGLRAGKPVREAAAKLGLDIESHYSTEISQPLLQWATHVLLMNDVHWKKLRLRYGRRLGQVQALLGSFLDPQVMSIPDLAFIKQHTPEFDRVVGMIGDACDNFAKTYAR